MLDRCTIQTALGKCPLRQQMQGISGKVSRGVSLAIDVSAYESNLRPLACPVMIIVWLIPGSHVLLKPRAAAGGSRTHRVLR